ncbi:UPF0001 protein YggS [hydrothermal vent metagenome]|uniref:UPF0001 protein YggS n=1 Tax=hydrothermal vent metagenome TaxID=652676 RepID=A0A3B0TR63_9ZZZZ
MDKTSNTQVKTRLGEVRAAILNAERAAGRPAGTVNLIAVSKTFPATDIEPALHAGQHHFGENRVQEALGKWPDLKAGNQGVKLHLIGPLQTNKARDAVRLFDGIHTVDRMKLARVLAGEIERQQRQIELFVQINTGAEPQKSGVLPKEADAFLRDIAPLGLNIVGLMCIPPMDQDPSTHFALLKTLADRNGLSRLSMGMSHDFETAIALGATDIRVGSAIFGSRDKP